MGYAIVDLAARARDLHRYLRDLEAVLILALAEFGIVGGRVAGLTGVWVGDAKVAAIGIRVSRWVTHHGFALNVDTDLSYFDLIVPCGIADRRVTSMEALLGHPVDRGAVEDALGRAFHAVFGRTSHDDDLRRRARGDRRRGSVPPPRRPRARASPSG